MNLQSKYTTLATIALSIGLVACSDETTVSITTKSDVSIANASITMASITKLTDELGHATVVRKDAREPSVLLVEAPDYVSQSVIIDAVTADKKNSNVKRTLSMQLKAKNPVRSITDIGTANKVTLESGNIFVDFTPNSFITEDGTPAIGKAEVSITPWKPTNSEDIQAFLGSGVGKNLQGDVVQLLNYGAVTIDFSQNGKKLRLAKDKNITIGMPLTFTNHYNGDKVTVGDSLPIWYFSEEQGIWREKSKGQVVTDAYGNLSLTADTSHLSTWSWGVATENPSSVFVQCQLPNGHANMCTVSADITHNNGSTTKTKPTVVSEKGVEIVNISPSFDTLTFNGKYYDLATDTMFTGTFVSKDMPKDGAIIVLQTLEDLKVKCQLPSGMTSDCVVSGFVNYYDRTSTEIASQIVPRQGVNVAKYPNLMEINLAASYYDKKNNTMLSGTFTSNTLSINDVVVVLDKEDDLSTITRLQKINEDGWRFSSHGAVTYQNVGQEPIVLTNEQIAISSSTDNDGNVYKNIVIGSDIFEQGLIDKEATYVIDYTVSRVVSNNNNCSSPDTDDDADEDECIDSYAKDYKVIRKTVTLYPQRVETEEVINRYTIGW